MSDIVDPKVRSRMMSGIKAGNTKPEVLVRKELHARGYRFRLHRKDLPGSPDIVLPKFKAVIFVNGCFWHGHRCRLFKWPRTRPEFWRDKITTNIHRDRRKMAELRSMGWRVCVLWECELRGSKGRQVAETVDRIAEWLKDRERVLYLPDSTTQCSGDKE